MTTSAMRDHIMAYLIDADDAQIQKLYSLLGEDAGSGFSVELTNEQLEFLDKERNRYINGEGKSYSWEQVKDAVRKRKAL